MAEAESSIVGINHGKEIILLTGAPRRQDLLWEDADLIANGFQIDGSETGEDDHSTSWRLLLAKNQTVHTGVTQDQHYPIYFEPGAIQASLTDARTRELQEESFLTEDASISLYESLWTTDTVPSQIKGQSLNHIQISNLNGLPAAEHVESRPRSDSYLVNLVVTVLATQPAQTFQTGKKEADLVRLSVADETCSAFEVNIWLDHENRDGDSIRTSRLKEMVTGLKNGDIVLFQNVALRSFRGVVSATVLKWTTDLVLLYRQDAFDEDNAMAFYSSSRIYRRTRSLQSSDTVLAKVVRILDWQDKYLSKGIGKKPQKRTGLMTAGKNVVGRIKPVGIALPEDTQ